MIYKIYTVFDAAAGLFLQPFFMRTQGEAVRAFADMACDPKHNFCRHARDYRLYELGEYGEESGAVLTHQEPIGLVTAVEMQQQFGVGGFDVVPVDSSAKPWLNGDGRPGTPEDAEA